MNYTIKSKTVGLSSHCKNQKPWSYEIRKEPNTGSSISAWSKNNKMYLPKIILISKRTNRVQKWQEK